MKTSGDYALMHANGMSWSGVVEAIRAEAAALYCHACGCDCGEPRLPETMKPELEDSNR